MQYKFFFDMGIGISRPAPIPISWTITIRLFLQTFFKIITNETSKLDTFI